MRTILKVLDEWTWPEPENDQVPSSYFNGISAVTSNWRSVGHPRKIKNSASKLFSNQVAVEYFGQTPGRCLRGRLLSVESVEKIVAKALTYIGSVFAAVSGGVQRMMRLLRSQVAWTMLG